METELKQMLQTMVTLLTRYEVELTAYHLVLTEAENRAVRGIPMADIRNQLNNVSFDPRATLEARALYEPLQSWLEKKDGSSLEKAAASVAARLSRLG